MPHLGTEAALGAANKEHLPMKNWIAFSLLALAVAVPAAAIEYRITLGGDRMSGEDRVRRLEMAVEELQRKVFQLQSEAITTPKVNPRAHFCEVSACGKSFQSFGPTRLEAESEVKAKCDEAHGDMFCKKITCRENQ